MRYITLTELDKYPNLEEVHQPQTYPGPGVYITNNGFIAFVSSEEIFTVPVKAWAHMMSPILPTERKIDLHLLIEQLLKLSR